MLFAIGRLGNRTAAEAKLGAPRVAARPAADLWGERADLFGAGGCLGARQGGLFWRRRSAARSGQLSFGAAVGSGEDRDGDPLDLRDRNCPGSQKAKHDADATGDAALAVSPTSDAPRADAKQLGDVMLREAERAECRAKLNR
jgi:hypothetical protein